MDLTEYKGLYEKLMSEQGRQEIGSDPKLQNTILQQINRFLQESESRTREENPPVLHRSIKDIFQKTVQTMIDIIHDISSIISNRSRMSHSEMRRKLVDIWFQQERRFYVGLWVLFFALVIYFLDSSS